MITRRLFLGGILAATGAPAIVRSGVLMPVRPAILVPDSGLSLILNEASRHEAQFVLFRQEMSREILRSLLASAQPIEIMSRPVGWF